MGWYPLKAELERIKKHLNELYTREAEALRNSRDHAELERDSLRTENERLKNSISAINQDLAVIRSQKEAEWWAYMHIGNFSEIFFLTHRWFYWEFVTVDWVYTLAQRRTLVLPTQSLSQRGICCVKMNLNGHWIGPLERPRQPPESAKFYSEKSTRLNMIKNVKYSS